MSILDPHLDSKHLEEYWDDIARKTKSNSGSYSTTIFRDQEIIAIKKFFGDLKGKKILKLDLWSEANNTEIGYWMIKEGADLTAIDISKEVVKRANDKLKQYGLKANFIIGDMRKMPFPDNTFDFLYTMGTIEHVHELDDVVNEIYRVMKPKGIAIVGVPNLLDSTFKPFFLYVTNKAKIAPYGDEKTFSPYQIVKLLKRKFEIIGLEGIFMPWIIRYPDMLFFRKSLNMTKLLKIPLLMVDYLSRVRFFRLTGHAISCAVRKE